MKRKVFIFSVLFVFSFFGIEFSSANITQDSALILQVKQLKVSLSEMVDDQKADAYKAIGANYQRLSKFDSALYYYRQGLLVLKDSDNKALQSSLLYNIGIVNMVVGQYDKALQSALAALAIDQELEDTTSIALSLNSVALIYQEWGQYEKSLEYRLESIRLSELDNNLHGVANSKYNMGNLYVKIGKPAKALEYFEEAKEDFLELLSEYPDDLSVKQGVSESIYSIGVMQVQKEQFNKASANFREALAIKRPIADKVGMANCFYQIGLIEFKQKDYENARQSFFQALQLKNLVGDVKGIALVNHQIGNLYCNMGLNKESENFLNRSILYAKENGDKEILRENYKLLYQIYFSKAKSAEALQYHVLYKAYADSVLSENTTKVVEELSVRYETEKKEKENVLLQQENEINTLTIQKQKSVGRYLLGVILLVLSIVVILYILFRSKQRTNKVISLKNALLGQQNEQIVSQKKVIERKNRDLTDSIVYAKRIQESMLVQEEKLNTFVDDAFIFFKPKDIVSGDFYWFGEKDGKVIVSAIDCTGHGVPGAFMSMLGNSFLNQIIHNEGICSPDLILEELNKNVQVALKQAETSNRDGMDMALCTIDKSNRTLEFAGAKNPLVIIKNGEAMRIKGDKNPIGLSYGSTNEFKKHTIELNESASYYMFSDGYVDQFGGPKHKKYMVKNLQNLLLEVHQKPMAEQKQILESTLSEWMKDEEQIDDVLVVGFKINAQ